MRVSAILPIFLFSTFFVMSFSVKAETSTCEQISQMVKLSNDMADVFVSSKVLGCTDLKVGQSKEINLPEYLSPTGVPHLYELKRKSDKEYEVRLNIEFHDGAGSLEDQNEKWRDISNKCLQKYADKMKGPHGESLQIIVENSSNRWTKNYIEISDIERSHSRNWNSNLSSDLYCPTVIHELLHLTGLVDEYQEQSGVDPQPITGFPIPNKKNASLKEYDCRQTYNGEPSIMSNHWDAVDKVDDKVLLKMIPCSCDDPKKCETSLKENCTYCVSSQQGGYYSSQLKVKKINLPKDCPKGFAEVNKSFDISMPYSQFTSSYDFSEKLDVYNVDTDKYEKLTNEDQQKNAYGVYIYKVLKIESPIQMKSLLRPRHFNAIVFPGCLSKNIEYYKDSLNAYRTSIPHHGEGCLETGLIHSIMKKRLDNESTK